jgi:bifunctional DNase/RNase
MSDQNNVSMRVDTIVIDPKTNAPVMILRGEQDPKLYLPIFIGQLEAASIASVIAGLELPRPMTHDLLVQLLDCLGAQVSHVTVTALKDDTFYAEVSCVDSSGNEHQIDARPSDGVAIALRLGAPILVAEAVLAEAGGYSDESEDEVGAMEAVEAAESSPAALADVDVRLEDLDAGTFGKYKM